jgi:two-component system chemotaxis response regulator CheB
MKPGDPNAPTRVLLVESMRAQRQRLSALIDAAPALALVGVAGTSNDALEAAARLRPDVIAINTQVIGSDGFAITQRLMQHSPAPVVLFCADPGARAAAAMAAGALTVIQAPGSRAASDHDHDSALFVQTLRVMAGVPVVTRFRPRRPDASAPASRPAAQGYELLAIAASTGGPGAIQRVISRLGPGFPLPIVLVQHIARNFIQSLADWLSSTTALPVAVVAGEQRLQPGSVYVAQSNHHLIIPRRGWAAARPGDDGAAYCPSADVLFHSVAQSYGPRAIGLILSGMGDDGARGLAAMRQVGGLTLAQDEASCVVYGMPQAAVRANAVQQVGPLDELAAIINQYSPHR